jgi:hypothetical protein
MEAVSKGFQFNFFKFFYFFNFNFFFLSIFFLGASDFLKDNPQSPKIKISGMS